MSERWNKLIDAEDAGTEVGDDRASHEAREALWRQQGALARLEVWEAALPAADAGGARTRLYAGDLYGAWKALIAGRTGPALARLIVFGPAALELRQGADRARLLPRPPEPGVAAGWHVLRSARAAQTPPAVLGGSPARVTDPGAAGAGLFYDRYGPALARLWEASAVGEPELWRVRCDDGTFSAVAVHWPGRHRIEIDAPGCLVWVERPSGERVGEAIECTDGRIGSFAIGGEGAPLRVCIEPLPRHGLEAA
jgi:hypothetical protein